MTFDGEAFGKEMVEIVRGYVAAEFDDCLAKARDEMQSAVDRLDARIAELEKLVSQTQKEGVRNDWNRVRRL